MTEIVSTFGSAPDTFRQLQAPLFAILVIALTVWAGFALARMARGARADDRDED